MILLCCPYIGCIKSFKVNIPNHPAFSWQICWFPEVCVWDKLESLSFLGRSKEGHKFSLFTSTVLLHTGIIRYPFYGSRNKGQELLAKISAQLRGDQIFTSLFLPVHWGNLWTADNEPLPAQPVRNWKNLSNKSKGQIWKEMFFFKKDTWW